MCAEDEKLRQDLEKVEQLENKVTKELSELREKIDQMNSDLGTYSDTESQRAEAEQLKQVSQTQMFWAQICWAHTCCAQMCWGQNEGDRFVS